jgi:murein DD-endopeptidase MepM/ murein hydrolase activator NlpD
LIRTPISGARLSSSFGNRRHPVSGYNAMHKGVDFAAPRGTPIIAAGDGIITEAGWKGSYGRYVRIRHNGIYDTAYAHMSRLASGISRGSRVAQGQVIGYVGSTGRVTGAHLHYEVMVNNRQVNPMTVRLPTGKRIDPSYHQAFAKVVERVDNELLSRGVSRFAQAD